MPILWPAAMIRTCCTGRRTDAEWQYHERLSVLRTLLRSMEHGLAPASSTTQGGALLHRQRHEWHIRNRHQIRRRFLGREIRRYPQRSIRATLYAHYLRSISRLVWIVPSSISKYEGDVGSVTEYVYTVIRWGNLEKSSVIQVHDHAGRRGRCRYHQLRRR